MLAYATRLTLPPPPSPPLPPLRPSFAYFVVFKTIVRVVSAVYYFRTKAWATGQAPIPAYRTKARGDRLEVNILKNVTIQHFALKRIAVLVVRWWCVLHNNRIDVPMFSSRLVGGYFTFTKQF